jgi:hypothetical protein
VDAVWFRVGGSWSMQRHTRWHGGRGQRWWRFLRGPSWHGPILGVLTPLVVASGALRPAAMEALEVRWCGDCLVARRGAEEQRHNSSGTSAPWRSMTRVGLLPDGIAEHTRTATTGDLTLRSSTTSLGIVQSSCERSSGEGNELRFIVGGINIGPRS